MGATEHLSQLLQLLPRQMPAGGPAAWLTPPADSVLLPELPPSPALCSAPQPPARKPREAAVPREASGHCSRPTTGTQPVTARLSSTPCPPPCSAKVGDWTPPVNRLCAASSPSCSRSRTLAVASTAPEAGAAPLMDQLPVLPAPAEPTCGHHLLSKSALASPFRGAGRGVRASPEKGPS